jgi:prepilin-type N-terminal cleavage/methylation domain-containing protein
MVYCREVKWQFKLGKIMKKQRGFSLLEITIVLAIIGFLAMIALEKSVYETSMIKARALGIELYEVHNATRKFASINSANPDLRIGGSVIIENGLSWLKSTNDCDVGVGTANSNYLNCNQEDSTKFGNLTYLTEINPLIDDNTVRIKTVLDVKSLGGGNSTVLPEDVLGLAAMVARGGASSISVNVDGINGSVSDPSMSNTSSLILFCNENIDTAFLNENCTDVNSSVIEGGLIVMITESSSTSSSWLLTNGGNAMQNNLQFSSSNPDLREINGVDRVYNLTGEILKLGNSGVYFDDGSNIPILGDGLVIDTDMYAVGDIKSMGDIEVEGDILSEGNVFVEEAIYSKGSIITESDIEVWGDQYVLGQTFINGGANVFGTLTADRVRSNTFIEAREISANGGIYAGQLVNAPIIRASVNLISEGDLTVAGDSVVGGNEYIEGNSVTQGTIFAGEDLIADGGNSYLDNVFATAIYDNDGNYVIDPSGISRLNVMRADKLAPSTSGGVLSMNSNEFLFAAESAECNAASEECATALEGYLDMENLYVKNINTGNWERLVDWIARIQATADENEVAIGEDDDADDNADDDDAGFTGPECYVVSGGIMYYGNFVENGICP